MICERHNGSAGLAAHVAPELMWQDDKPQTRETTRHHTMLTGAKVKAEKAPSGTGGMVVFLTYSSKRRRSTAVRYMYHFAALMALVHVGLAVPCTPAAAGCAWGRGYDIKLDPI